MNSFLLLFPMLFFFLLWGIFALWGGASWRRVPYEARFQARTKKGIRGPRRSDRAIQDDIIDRIALHDSLDASEIRVTVKEGRVHLSGSVPTRAEKRTAEWLAELVPGVVEVKNEISVTRVVDRAA